ncbi:response regulator transcription factor [Parafilimonas sp.]|uniref:response regulator transcription factor n=1 Tax=Parafilimonas sp. TaxID=1969739 RepID=UPI003F7DBF74
MTIKLLYAEDEASLGKIVSDTLESRGFIVYMEEDGNKVLERFTAVKPDVCVLDVMLPHRNGFELAEDIRRLDNDIPIIFLTAKTQTEDVLNGFRMGGNDYIRKPFSIEELIARLYNVLRIKKELPDQKEPITLPIGKYRFNTVQQMLRFEGEERKLSYRENELLKYLWKHRNSIINRSDLLNTIWGNDSFFNSRNLDVYITRLRNYLKADKNLEILTIKGIGYRFIID